MPLHTVRCKIQKCSEDKAPYYIWDDDAECQSQEFTFKTDESDPDNESLDQDDVVEKLKQFLLVAGLQIVDGASADVDSIDLLLEDSNGAHYLLLA